jgi:hypothetical protein
VRELARLQLGQVENWFIAQQSAEAAFTEFEHAAQPWAAVASLADR